MVQDGGCATRAPQNSQKAVVTGMAFLHRGQLICFFFFTPEIFLPPEIPSGWTYSVRYFCREVKNPLGQVPAIGG